MTKDKNNDHSNQSTLRNLRVLEQIGERMTKHYETILREVFDEQKLRNNGPISVDITRYGHWCSGDDIDTTVISFDVRCRESQLRRGLSWKELGELRKNKKD